MHRIDGPGATVDNRFTEGDPVGGVQATVVTDDWLNDVQEELINVLAAGDVTPVKGSQGQLLLAISKLAQVQKSTAFTASGSATTLTLSPSPAIAEYSANQRFRVKFNVASTGAATLNVSAVGAKSLKQFNSAGVKVAAVFTAGMITDVEYDGVDMVLIDPLPPSVTVPDATTSSKGIVSLAVSSDVVAGTDSAKAVTSNALELARPKKADCTAWVNFNGTGTVAIRNSYNCLSITDNGTGDYTFNWSNQTSATYSFSQGVSLDTNTGSASLRIPESGPVYTATQLRLLCGVGSASVRDPVYGSVQIFGGQSV